MWNVFSIGFDPVMWNAVSIGLDPDTYMYV
jgi:hypothetical protein